MGLLGIVGLFALAFLASVEVVQPLPHHSGPSCADVRSSSPDTWDNPDEPAWFGGPWLPDLEVGDVIAHGVPCGWGECYFSMMGLSQPGGTRAVIKVRPDCTTYLASADYGLDPHRSTSRWEVRAP